MQNIIAISLLLLSIFNLAHAENSCLDIFTQATKNPSYWVGPRISEDGIVVSLQKLISSGISPNAALLQKSTSTNDAISLILSDLLGKPVTGSKLYQDAVRFHKIAWSEWLQKSGFNANNIALRQKAVSQAEVIAIIKAFHKAQIPVTDAAFRKNVFDEKALKIIFEITGRELTPAKIYKDATAHHQHPWIWWQKKAKINLEAAGISRARLAEQEIISSLKTLSQNGYPLWPTQLRELAQNENASNLLLSEVGKKINTYKVYIDATVYYKKPWSWWLKQAHVSSAKGFRRQPKLSSTEIIFALSHLYDSKLKIALNDSAARFDKTTAVNEFLLNEMGLDVTLAKIYSDAVRGHQKPWSWWLEQADIPLDFVAKRKAPLTEAQIFTVIQHFAANNLPLHRSAFEPHWESHLFGGTIYKLIDRWVSPGKVFLDATRVHRRPWDQWLVMAGLNPNEIRLRGSAPVHLLTEIMRQELASNYEAVTKGGYAFEGKGDGESAIIAVDPRTPESALVQKQHQDAVEDLQNKLTPQEQIIFERMVEFIEKENYFDVSEVTLFVRQKDPTITSENILALLVKIKSMDELKDQLFGDQ